MPGPTSIYHLWKAFDINSDVSGASGENSRPEGHVRKVPDQCPCRITEFRIYNVEYYGKAVKERVQVHHYAAWRV